MSDLNALIAQYKTVREEKDRFAKFYSGKIDELSQQIEAHLTAQGLSSARTDAGLVTTYLRRTVKVADWAEFGAFAEEHPELIKQSIDSTEAMRLLDDDVAIPGVEVNSTQVLSVK